MTNQKDKKISMEELMITHSFSKSPQEQHDYLIECFKEIRADEREERAKEVIKIIDGCADKTDIWGDEERWAKFRKLVKQKLREKWI